MLDEDSATNSEIVWSFSNAEVDLLRKYPAGRSLSDRLFTTSGQVWAISLFPNGLGRHPREKPNTILSSTKAAREEKVAAELENPSRMDLYVELVENDFDRALPTIFDFVVGKLHLRIEDPVRGITYSVDDLAPKRFDLFAPEHDTSFERRILEECSAGCTITIGVTQYSQFVGGEKGGPGLISRDRRSVSSMMMQTAMQTPAQDRYPYNMTMDNLLIQRV